MYRHYLKTVYRNFFIQKAYSAINIVGLAVGIACCLLITMWVLDELSCDRFHDDVDQIHMVLTGNRTEQGNWGGPAPLAPALKERFPEIEYATRYGGLYDVLLSHQDRRYFETEILAVDPSFLKMFSFPFRSGDRNTALDDLYSIVITQEVAERYFGNENPMGRVLTMDNKREFTVTGVIERIPHNSSLHFDMLVPFAFGIIQAKEVTGLDMGWGWYSPATYIKTRRDCAIAELVPRMSEHFRKLRDSDDVGLGTIPFASRNLYWSNTEEYLYIFSGIAFLILVMACINFVNLSTARSSIRAKETGLRKVVGASRRNLVEQFLSESVLLSIGACLCAFVLVEILLPLLNEWIGTEIPSGLLRDPVVLGISLALACVVGIVAGSYPAFFLSSVQPVRTLRGTLTSGAKSSVLKPVLVITQFSCSILLIIGTAVVYQQLGFMKSEDIGYDKEQVVNVWLRGDSKNSYEALKAELLRDNRILGVSGCAAGLPVWYWTSSSIDWDGKDPNDRFHVHVNFVDYDFIETLGIEMVGGRSFSRDHPSDLTSAYLINEEMAQALESESVIGARLELASNPGNIVGVMKDFHFRSLRSRIGPLVFALKPEDARMVSIRLRPGDITGALEFIQATWANIIPLFPFDYTFLDEDFDQQYQSYKSLGNLSGAFALIAVFIASLGLLGLAAFAAEQRTKEIGIRKVLGATVSNIVRLLSKEFLFLVLIANIVAWPLAYYLMNRWLEEFAYHMNLRWETFWLAGGLALAIAIVTVASQAIRAATSNPIDTLRRE